MMGSKQVQILTEPIFAESCVQSLVELLIERNIGIGYLANFDGPTGKSNLVYLGSRKAKNEEIRGNNT